MLRKSPVRRRLVMTPCALLIISAILVACTVVEARNNRDTNTDPNGVADVPADELPAQPDRDPDALEPDEPSEPVQPIDDEEIELEEYSTVAVFNLAYNQTFFAGGYWVEDHGFSEGEAVRWSITAGEGETKLGAFEAERALLRVGPDRSQWWYIRYSQDQYRFECEVRLDEFETPVEMWHREDPEDEPSFHEFDYDQAGHFGEGDSDELRALEEAGISTLVYLTSAEYQQALQDTVVLRVPAGEFEVDYLVYDFEDAQTNERFRYEWWVTREVPGHLTRFLWQDYQSGRELAGELLEITTDYRSPIGGL